MAYAVIRTDNMSGTVEAKNLVSVKYAGDIENGSIVVIGDYLDGEREVREATAPAIDADIKTLGVVATPEVVKDKTYFALSDFINEEGDISRVYRLTYHDLYSVTAEAFADGSVLEEGSVVELNGTLKPLAVASATDGSTTIGHIKLIEDDMYLVEIDY